MEINLKIVNWNIEWARPKSQRGKIIKKKIESLSPDLICLTETYHDFLKEEGYTILSSPDYGYSNTEGKHKVALWSKNKWKLSSNLENYRIPSGRLIYGQTNTVLGELNILGLCIPWKDSHVLTGNKNKKPWEDHLEYLERLSDILEEKNFQNNTIIIGDFNQRIPRKYSPIKVYDKLIKTFKTYKLLTGAEIERVATPTIDHIFCSTDIEVENLFGLDNVDNKIRLSDHFGIFASLKKKDKYQ